MVQRSPRGMPVPALALWLTPRWRFGSVPPPDRVPAVLAEPPRPIANNHAPGDSSLDHPAGQGARVEIDETLMHDCGALSGRHPGEMRLPSPIRTPEGTTKSVMVGNLSTAKTFRVRPKSRALSCRSSTSCRAMAPSLVQATWAGQRRCRRGSSCWVGIGGD